MKTLRLYYATNRNHVGSDRWKPAGYGSKFSDYGSQNLRFGKLDLNVDEVETETALAIDTKFGSGNGNALAGYLKPLVAGADIAPFPESIDPAKPDAVQPAAKLGSQAMFAELQAAMQASSDVLLYIHGFNVSWADAVASALALQENLNQADDGKPDQRVLVVLFTWPSDGLALPYASYISDRHDARISGPAVARALLKARDFLRQILTRDARGFDIACGQELHLLCHSMGNYVLQNALDHVAENTPGNTFPRLFEHIFLCAPDVDDTALEPDHPLGALHELAQHVTIYYNRADVAMYVSTYTKANPERLGHNGAARPALLHNKVHQVDCSPIVKGLIEHSYYMDGYVNQDIRFSISSMPFDDPIRTRKRREDLPNVWEMQPLNETENR